MVVNLIGAVLTQGGLSTQTELDENDYGAEHKETDTQMEGLSIEGDNFHGEWNYTLPPRSLAG